jgi:hypothetical protein
MEEVPGVPGVGVLDVEAQEGGQERAPRSEDDHGTTE